MYIVIMFEDICPTCVGHKSTLLTIMHYWTQTSTHGILPPCRILVRHLDSYDKTNFEGFQQHREHASSFWQHITHYNNCCHCQKEKKFNILIEFEVTEYSYSIRYMICIQILRIFDSVHMKF